MQMKLLSGAVAIAASAVLAILLASCATSSGGAFQRVVAVETKEEKPEEKSEVPPGKPPAKTVKGLEIVSVPDKADVLIDNRYVGRTPVLVEKLEKGRHLLTIHRDGYYEVSAWIDFIGEYMLFQTNLVRITGFLQISVSPADSSVYVGDSAVSQGLLELPTGIYSVRVRAFGYAEYQARIAILEKSITALSIALDPAAFDFTTFSVSRKTVNPENPGRLALLEASFSVTGPGAGRIMVIDAQGAKLHSEELPDFQTWDQSYSWNLLDPSGRPIPDGEYLLRLAGKGKDSETEIIREIGFKIDRSFRISMRSLWSGGSGLLYASTPEVLPAGSLQAAFLGAVHAEGSLFRAPVQLGVRAGLGSGLEMDLLAGLILENEVVPLTGSLTVRYAMPSPDRQALIASALEIKAAFQYQPTSGVLLTDGSSNFTGISLGLPIQITLGPARVLAGAGAIASFWQPYGTLQPLLASWVYLRGGILLDFGQVMAGISASARTKPLPQGIFSLSSAFPVQAGAEIHWLLPNSHIVLSGVLTAEFNFAPAGFYVNGGGGLGLLF